MKSFAT